MTQGLQEGYISPQYIIYFYHWPIVMIERSKNKCVTSTTEDKNRLLTLGTFDNKRNSDEATLQHFGPEPLMNNTLVVTQFSACDSAGTRTSQWHVHSVTMYCFIYK